MIALMQIFFEHRGQAGRCPVLGPYVPMEQKSRISHKWPVGNAFGPLETVSKMGRVAGFPGFSLAMPLFLKQFLMVAESARQHSEHVRRPSSPPSLNQSSSQRQ